MSKPEKKSTVLKTAFVCYSYVISAPPIVLLRIFNTKKKASAYCNYKNRVNKSSKKFYGWLEVVKDTKDYSKAFKSSEIIKL